MMMYNIYNPSCEVFQVDSSIVKHAYQNYDNYIIENEGTHKEHRKICAIYFSGHSIYFPNTVDSFEKNIIQKNRYEWFGHRIPEAAKHIFIRDIHKQWYLSGINVKFKTPELLLDFLKKETDGYEVVTVGSSAGGYAALLYGIQLDAKVIYAFSPRIYLDPLEYTSTESKNPLFFRLKNTPINKYFDLSPFISKSKSQIYCFYPSKSELDKIQLEHIKNQNLESNPNVHIIKFRTSKHGVPFPKIALDKILSYNAPNLKSGKIHIPIIFSIQQVGFFCTINGILSQGSNFLKKRLKK